MHNHHRGHRLLGRCAIVALSAISGCDSPADPSIPPPVDGIAAETRAPLHAPGAEDALAEHLAMPSSLELWNTRSGQPPGTVPVGEVLASRAAQVLAQYVPSLLPGVSGPRADVFVLLGAERMPRRVLQRPRGIGAVDPAAAATAFGLSREDIRELTVTGTDGQFGDRVRLIWISLR